MAENTLISWCDHTLNLWWGCFKIASTCKFCYAQKLDNRYHEGKGHWNRDGDRLFVKSWKSNLNKFAKIADQTGVEQDVFVMSMGDIFDTATRLVDKDGNHVGNVDDVRREFFNLVPQYQGRLNFLILTQRPENAAQMLPQWWHENPPKNAAIGVSVGTQEEYDKYIHMLWAIPAHRRFMSIEPMLENIKFWSIVELIPDWIIVGGDSIGKDRKMDPEWVRGIQWFCKVYNTAFHFKQWGKPEYNPDPNDPTIGHHGGYLLDGKAYRDRMPWKK